LYFEILGPLRLLDAGRPIEIGSRRQRALLAVLVVNANRVVSADRLLDLVWGEDVPEGGVKTLRFHVSKLRDALESGRARGDEGLIMTRAPGYALVVDSDHVDALRFEGLTEEAGSRLHSDPAAALDLLDAALGLWRGPPLDDFAYEEFARPEVLRLEELHLTAMEERFDALLALNRHAAVVGELTALTDQHPHRERLWSQLMVALYRSGRQADALDVFQRLRKSLGDELGIEPSSELTDLEGRILLQDPDLLQAGPTPAADRLRGYELRGRLGEGAFGEVWRATQPGVEREVAVKAIRPEYANRPEFVRRFEAEARLVASLEHPHIVSLFDFWRDPEGAYLVMPLLHGGSLGGLMRQGPLVTDRAVELLEAIGSALSYAHRQGVIHRDVTPENVLLDEDGNPYLSDFGVASLVGEESVASPSPAYLSPEQMTGEPTTPASDVFSLGVLAHAMLTGTEPMPAETGGGDRGATIELPARLDRVIGQATALEPANRFQDVTGFLAALHEALGTAAPAPPLVTIRNPYKGLRVFDEIDAADFFGRDLVVDELVQAMSRHRLIGVVGPSGCGKSSLVRAGLIPAIRNGALSGSERWLIADLYPGAHPFTELQSALLRVAVERPAGLTAPIDGAGVDWADLVDRLLPGDEDLALVVDQFEELFTLTDDEDVRRRFLDTLADLVADPRHRVRVVVTLRADYYHRPLEHARFGELLRRGLVSVVVPSKECLLQAASGPAEAVGLTLESGLAETIVGEVSNQPGGLPLMEYALTELFHHRTDTRLTTAGYQRTGGVLGALGRRAEQLYTGYDDPGCTAAQQVFLRLVTVTEGAEDTRRRIPLIELQMLGVDPGVLTQVLDDYGSHRLLTFDRDPETRAPTVEVAHEALLTRWDRLRGWIDERRDDIVIHRRLGIAVAEWRAADSAPGYLLSGGRLSHYEAFAADTDLALTTDERNFLTASRHHADELEARRRRRRRGVLIGFATAAVIAVVLAVVAFINQQSAENATAEARERTSELEAEKTETARLVDEVTRVAAIARARELSASSAAALDDDPELAVLLASEAIAVEVDGAPRREAISALHEAIITSRLRFSVPGSIRVAVDAAGRRIASGQLSSGDAVRVHDVETGELIVTLPVSTGEEELLPFEISVAMSPDGARLATGRSDGTIAMWDPTTGEELFSTNDRQAIWSDASSGTFTLTLGESTTQPIAVDASAEDIEVALESMPEIVDVVVTGEGTEADPWRVVVADTDAPYLARLVAVTGNLSPESATVEIGGRGHDHPDATEWGFDGVAAIEFSPDGTVLASRGWDETIRLWNPSDLTEKLSIEAATPPRAARGMAFSRDGELLASADGVEEVSVWETTGGQLLHTLVGEAEQPMDVAFLPDGDLVVAYLWTERTLSLWSLESETEQNLPVGVGFLRSVAVSPDGTRLAAGDEVGAIHIIELSEAGPEPLLRLPGDGFRVMGLAFSTDSILVSVSDQKAQVWDLGPAGNSEWLTFSSFSPHLLPTVAYSPDGARLAYAPVDGDVLIVDAETGDGLVTLDTNSDVTDLAFSPDGIQIAMTTGRSAEGAVQIRDASSGELLAGFVVRDEGEEEVGWPDDPKLGWSLDFSRDGALLAAVVGPDVRVWDTDTLTEVLTLSSDDPNDLYRGLAFSPDGANLAVRGTIQGTDVVEIFDLAGNRIQSCCAHFWWQTLAAVEYSPDGKTLLTSGMDFETEEGTVKLWDPASGSEVATLEGHTGPAFKAIFSADGARIASGSLEDVRVWDAATNEELMTLPHGAAFGLTFSPDGTRLASSADNSEVRVWALDVDDLLQIAHERLTRTFTPSECDVYEIDPCPEA
jgi:WD40 repeat protein/DNA-binding SARP family transcriptional activator